MSKLPPDKDLDLELLRQIGNGTESSQRVLAQRMGISVGKINYLMQAVISRGWVKVDNFRRSDNKLAYAYLLTPSGVRAKMKLAQSFLARKELEFELLQQEIRNLRDEMTQGPQDSAP